MEIPIPIDVTRRSFLGGLFAAGAWTALGGQQFGEARLRFGVVSDVHFAAEGNDKIIKTFNDNNAKKAFAWFRDQQVDAVVCAGDIADRSLIDEVRCFANAWYSVFPDDRRPDGEKVEKLFVTGNHDVHGWGIKSLPSIWPDKVERESHIFAKHRREVWQELFHETYESIRVKTVKGYPFVLNMWEDDQYPGFGRRLVPFLKKHGAALKSDKPFFYVQHAHLKDTCYGPWAWGHDDGVTTKALADYPNCVAFSGHSHYPLTDERSIWQGAFTSIGAASLRYTGDPSDEFKVDGVRLTNYWGWVRWSALGMLVTVYDDAIVYTRRNFTDGCNIGDDWVQPIGKPGSAVFDFTERAKKFGAPQFPKDARLGLATEKNGALRLTVPATVVDKRARCWIYEATVTGADGKRVFRRFLSEGAEHGEQSKKAMAATIIRIAQKDLPTSPLKVVVTPLNCFGKAGTALEEMLG